ncbi:MAG: NYN domain-containing protein, partial [Candidatus Sungbacteria bacterium]|nr:NYN domain-containing protein [Candidatus Sungbacteria bacterium]
MEHYLSLARAAKERGVSQDYLRFLIFKKKLQGLKIGRNWVTTNAWLDTYVEHNGHAKFKSNASLPKPADPLSVIPASAGIQNNDKRKSFAKTFLQSVYDAIPRVRQATALIAVAATSLALGTFAIHASKKIDLRMLEPFASEDAWFSPSQGVAALIRVNDRLHTALGAALRETGQDIAVVPRTLASAVELFPDIHLADSLQRANVLDAIGKPFQKLIDPLGIALCQTLYHSCGAVAPLVRKLSPSPTPKDVGSLTESARGVSLSSTTPTTGGFRTPVNEHITEITRVREVVERTAVQNVIPVDLAVLKRNVLADVASINNSIRTEFENTIQGLRDRMNGTGVQFVNIGVQPSTNTIAPVVLSQKIDQLHDVVLYSPTVQSGITVASGGISVSGGIIGNLGIGTTSPSQLLSIAGHCVTGDTRLRRRRRRKNADGTDSDEYDYDEVPIKDIQPGDEIASLNEATGKIIWSKVNALMDMGVKPIYKLTTAGGKTIRTTGEHPYLVRVENQKAPRLTWDSLTRWAVDSHHTRRGEQSGFQSVTRLSGFTHQAHRTADYIMHQNENNPEIAFRTVFSSLWSVVLPIENQYIQYITRENLVKHAPVDNQNPSFSTGSKNNLATAMGSIARGNVSVKQGLWTKVHALAEGQEIAVSSADGKVAIWDRIEKIEHLPAEQVYDIEVEGTHNFIGNGIVAHNTYLTGGLGVGRATTTSNMLDVAGNGVFGGFLSASTFNATSTTATSTLSTGGLTVGTSQFVVQQTAGNVGIGTTSPAQLLSIAGHCVTGDTRLRRRRRRKGKNGEWIEEFDEVAIKDIQQGDEILTLDDASGTFVWRQVKGLMDMGVKQTYALITGTGKLIRTTASHPYFVRPIAHDGATIQKSTYAYAEQLARAHYFAKLHGRTVRVPALENSEVVFTRSGWEHFLEKKRSLNELITRFFALPRVETALAHASRGVAYQKREKPGMLVEYWTIEEIVEYVLVRVVVCAINNGPKFFLSCAWLGTKELEGIPANKKQLSLSEEKSPRRRRGMDTPQLFVPSLYSQRLDVSRGMWKKVAQLSTDYEVATVDGWEHIIAITPVAHEQVYDIEVEGTHNFIGNDIVAHNTYLTGGLGAGVVETGAGNITGTGRLSITSTTATSTFSTGGLTVGTSQFVVQQTAGNVGIGTTSPGTLVAIHGSAPILTLGDSQSSGAQYRLRNGSITAGTFDIYDNGAAASRLSINNAGNVGIGTTSPSAKFAFTGDGTGATRAFVIADSSNVERVSILNNGNVGIGTTGPLALLDVNGVSAAGLGAVGAPSFAIRTDLDTGMWSSGANTLNFSTGGSERVRFDSNGNVGIGTTSPAQLLSIAGHCVTGDTRLRRRRRKTRRRQGYGGRGKKANGEGEDEYDYDEVQIKDIKQGDEIASLDEQTGQIVWSKVKALMDMGVKPIYKLTTASGKTIRTTAEHPYLVKTSDPELPKKKPRLGVFFDNANMFYAQRDAGWRIDIIRLKRALEAQFDMAFFNHYHAVPVEGDPARQPTLDFMQSVGEEITFRTKPLKYIQTADGIKKKGDMDVEIALDVTERIGELDAVLAVSGDSDLLPLRYYAAQRGKKIAFAGFRRNMAWELTKFGKYTYLDEYRASLGRGEKINSKPELGVALVRLLYSRPPSLSSGGLWIKAAEIHEGQMVAVKGAGKTAVWDRVVSIEHTPAEQVYDIEVEGTHNFIGNDIVAHNTYLTGGLGAGVVETGAGNITGTGRLSITSTTATSTFSTGGLTVGTSQFVVQQTSGNVGIGTTSPG